MKKRIFYSITGVTLIALCIFSFLLSFNMYNQLFDSEKTQIKQEYGNIKKVLQAQERFDFSEIFTMARITVISRDGQVLFDNYENPSVMENHADRPEVLALQNQTSAESTRLSDTLGKQTYYYAEKLTSGDILRLAITTDSVYGVVLKTVPFMIIIAIFIIILSAFISRYLTKKIIAPLNSIDEPIYEELDLFYAKINAQKRKIKKNKAKLRQKAQEFEILTQNIGDGFVLLGKKNEIVSINKKAAQIFGNTEIDFLEKDVAEINHTSEFLNAIDSAYNGKSTQIQELIHNKDYVFHISPVIPTEEEVVGVVIIVVDNTEKAQSEKLRREFSANVSHELKTPLTSILGYAELVKTGMAKPEDIQKFCEKIHKEAINLLELIEDIMKISQIDEDNQEYEKEEVSLSETIETVVERLQDIANRKNISIEKDMQSVSIIGVKRIFEETLYNVIENAIKYNKEDGTVSINVSQDEENAIICVRDTGIGIPPESLDRIFERFYRVEKSRSGAVKGTGLGLAIVKHAVNLHNGTIAVTSELGQGTEITITVPLFLL